MKIAYIGRYNENEILSGPEKTARRIFGHSSMQNEVIFIQYFFDGNKFGPLTKLFAKDEFKTKDGLRIYTAGLFRLVPLLFKFKPDLIHIITFERFALLSFIYKMFRKAKVLYNSHGVIAYEDSVIKKSEFWYSFKDKFVEKRLLEESDRVIFPSEQAITKAERYYAGFGSKSTIMPNGIDETFSKPNNLKDFKGTLSAVVMNNSAYSQTGIEMLSRTLGNMNIELKLYCLGSFNGPEIESCSVSVQFVDFMDPTELQTFYLDKHIFFSLNKYDTFSIATAEAMASGLIPVVSNETGISGFITNEENGYKVNHGDIGELTDVLYNMEKNREKLHLISSSAMKIYDSLNWETVFTLYQDIYKEMIE